MPSQDIFIYMIFNDFLKLNHKNLVENSRVAVFNQIMVLDRLFASLKMAFQLPAK